jgi:hypothetical protein
LERILKIEFDHGSLAEEAFAWERGIDEIAEADEDMTGYIQQLEKTRDELQQSEGSGDILASEFEKFLQQATPKSEADGNAPEAKPEGEETEKDNGQDPQI